MRNPFDPEYFESKELCRLGFKSIGKNVQIQKNCVIVGLENISIADNVRIDGFSSIIAVGPEAKLVIGRNVHIGSYCLISAGNGIEIGDFCGLSQGVKIYSRSDDYTGEFLTNPTVPAQFTSVAVGTVYLSKHVLVGSSTVILPSLRIGEGASVGALSLVSKNLAPWGIYSGIPARHLRVRSRKLLKLEEEYLKMTNND